MAEDIYPLGQGKGLLTDILNFGLNNIYQYGQQAGASNRQLGQGMTDVAAGTPGAMAQLSPMIQDAINNNPIMAGVWGPIRTRGEKQAVSALWRQDPEKVMAVQADPRTLDLMAPRSSDVVKTSKTIEDLGLVPSGANAVYNPAEEIIKVAPSSLLGGHYEKPMPMSGTLRNALDTLRGLGLPGVDQFANRTRGGFVTKPGGTVNLPQTMTHEGEHFLNQPRIYQGPLTLENGDAAIKMFEQLSPYLTDHAIESATEGAMKYKDPRIALDEALSYLTGKESRMPSREAAGAHLHQILKTRTGPGGNRALQLTPETVQAAIDLAEGMAHPQLAPKAAEIWDQLAAKGQIGSRTGTYNPQTPYKDLEFTSMRQRTEPASMYERLPRAGRTFVTAEDLSRQKAGETLPALGSAMPDIPRPVSSPGALDAFEALRRKLGLPEADLGGAAPEFYGKKIPELESKRGGKALNDLFENLAAADQRMQPNRGPISPQDRFMDEVLANLAMATNKGMGEPGSAQGISGFRRRLAPVENQFNMATKPLNPQSSLDVLEQLKEYGFMEPGNLQKAMFKDPKASSHLQVNEKALERIKKLLERLGR